jgi:hypothetical protein
MRQKGKLEERYGQPNQGYRPRNAQKQSEAKENANESFRPANVYHQSTGMKEGRNINPGFRQNLKEERDRSERRDSRMKSKKSQA